MVRLRRVLIALAAALAPLPAGVAPNIVVIETDDQRQDEMSSLPLTRALIGQEGLTLTYVAPHVGGPVSVFERNDHGSTVSSPIMQNAFLGAQMPPSPAFDEADVSDKPRNIRRRPPLARREIARGQELWRTRRQALASVDQGVRRIVRALRGSGELDNTVLVFTSDNGYLLGEHRVRSGKVLASEPSIRVPLLMPGPGVPRGRTSRQLVWNGDLAPTILAAASGHAPWQTDGESLWPFIRH